MVVALITAAGHGTRMGQDVPKQFMNINDKPMIIYTLERFQNNPQIDSIMVVTLSNWFGFVWAYAKQFGISKLKWVVEGGNSGQESIYNGLVTLKNECDKDAVVMIHDGNRPMINDDIINDSLATYEKHGSSVAAIPCVEAVFRSENGLDSETSIPREALYRTQTPHTYTLEKLLWAHNEAKKKGITESAASCTLMHALGEPVYFSRGDEKNFKLTTLSDLDLFKALLLAEKNSKETWLKK